MNLFHQAISRKTIDGRSARRAFSYVLSVVLLGLCLHVSSPLRTFAQQPAATNGKPPAGIVPRLKKSEALQATIAALAANGSDAAWDSLKKIVTGETDMKELDREATRQVLMLWSLRGTPESDAFLIEVLCNTEQVRPEGKGTYPPAEIRSDLAQGLALGASPVLRESLADRFIDSATSDEARRAISVVLQAPTPQNIPLQVKLILSEGVESSLKEELTKSLAETNGTVVRQALGIAEAEETPDEAAVASNELPNGMPQLPPGMSPPGGMPNSPAGMIPPVDSLPGAKMGRGLFGALQRVFGSDPPERGAPGGAASSDRSTESIWGTGMTSSLAGQMANPDSDHRSLLEFLASIPSQSARIELSRFLETHWNEGPSELVGADKAPAVEDFAAGPVRGLRLGGKRGKDDDDQDAQPALTMPDDPAGPENRILSFGENWFDPGALVVLKSFPYSDRPREKPSRRPTTRANPLVGGGAAAGNQRALSPAAQRREEEKAARQKLLDARYDWRDAIERYVQVLNERFANVAEEPIDSNETTAEEESATSEKSTASASETSRGASVKGSEPVEGPNGLPFPLHPGAKVVKQFHRQWPATSGSGANIVDPMTVWYIRTEEEGSYAKTVSHYRVNARGKPAAMREIEEGRWIDVTQEEEGPDRVRSVDVFITHTPSDSDDRRASKDEPLIVEVLVVEIPKLVIPKSEKTDEAK